MKKVLSFLILLSQLCAERSYGQDIPFAKIHPPTEFPYSSITGITQDTTGYMWFTAGRVLYRYDGYKFISYTHDVRNINSLGKAELTAVYADRAGYVWIGTDGAGLDKFEPKKGSFVHYRNRKGDSSSIVNNTITSILEDREGNIWAGTKGGLSRLNKATGKFTSYTNNPADTSTLSHSHIRTIYEDRAGTIWVGCGSAFINDGTKRGEGGLNRFHPTAGKFTRYMHDPLDNYSLVDNRVEAIHEDSRGVFWVGTAGDGLHTLDRQTEKFTRHLFDPASPTKLSRPALLENVACGAKDHISFINEDVTGDIWIGSMGGVVRYTPQSGSVSHITSFGPDSLIDVSARVMYNSKDGVIWLGTWSENVYTIDPLRKRVPRIDLNSPVWCFHEDKNENLWVGTSAGIFLMDKNKKIVNHFDNNSLAIDYSDISHVIGINEDSKGTIWIGTTSGLSRYNNSTNTFTHFKNNPNDPTSISNGVVFSIYEDSKGTFWICTSGGLDIMNVSEGTFRHIRHNAQNSFSLGNNFVNGIFEDRRGNLWIRNWEGGGLHLFNRSSESFMRYLQGLSISCIFEDTDSTLWIGTEADGLYKYDKTAGNFNRFIDENSFLTSHIITTIIEDDLKKLWVASLAGIVCLDRSREQAVYYGINKGISSKDLRYGAGYKLKNGELLFGTGFGFYTFFPQQVESNKIPPKLAISDFNYFNKSHEPVKDSSLNAVLENYRKVELNYNQNSFSISFTGLHYSNSLENQHFYMLEGYDLKWQKAGSELKAEYFNMSPGRYVFHVRTANSDGIWVAGRVQIVITPAWWNTWWFRIAAIVAIFGIFYWIVRWRTNVRFQAKITQSEKEQQLAALRHRATELEMYALRSQMNPHFIFNSLNAINTFILEKNSDQAFEYLTMFSKLMRLILQNSRSEVVTLENELEALRLYLELEALRFDNHFSYSIKVDEDIDRDAVMVPPLIIQPYAENSIWHGLMHKEEKGFLLVEVLEEEEFLICRITDDGVGRQKAAELKSKSASAHKSMGMRITADRIAMMKKNNLSESHVRITDLVLPDGKPAGTSVEIKIPLNYD
jgi:ligand-binding sensor domain-containing protein